MEKKLDKTRSWPNQRSWYGVCFTAILQKKGINLHDFLFTSLDDNALKNEGVLIHYKWKKMFVEDHIVTFNPAVLRTAKTL